jgi:long-chain acyl-CoA synthetase
VPIRKELQDWIRLTMPTRAARRRALATGDPHEALALGTQKMRPWLFRSAGLCVGMTRSARALLIMLNRLGRILMYTVADRPWHKLYPAQVPKNVDWSQYRSVIELFDDSVKRFAHRVAFSCMGKSITYRELDKATYEFACFLRNHLNLKQGDRVALMLPNFLQYPIALFGVLRAGLTVVNTNPMYTPRELEYQLNDSGATAILVFDKFAATLEEVLAKTPVKHVITTGAGDCLGVLKGSIVNFVLRYQRKEIPAYSLPYAITFNQALGAGRGQKLPEVTTGPEDIAFLQYTGGTTGVSKGAMLLHRNMVANMVQAAAWVGFKVNGPEELIVTALPMYHIFALTVNCLVFLQFGARNHLIPNPRDMTGFVKELASLPFTAITGVNTLFNGLMNTPGFDQINFSKLKLTVGGGAAVLRSTAEKWQKLTGCALIEGYGLTETAPSCCMNPVDSTEYSGAIGVPLPSTDVVLRDDINQDVPHGEVGELCTRGPQVMAGYWQRPDETSKVLDPDGWLHTGDMAKINEKGMFQIVDRKKDMILVSGFNVYPNEIEDVVALHPGVLEVAAVGVPDEKAGEAVKIVIVKKDPNLSEAAIREHCKVNMTGYKQPKIVEFRAELPKSNVGKILRRELRGTA